MTQIESKITSTYRVRDIYEAAYLYACGCKLTNLEPVSNFFYFVFSNEDECLIFRDEYWRNQGSIDPKLYSDSIKLLKQQVFQQEDRGRHD